MKHVMSTHPSSTSVLPLNVPKLRAKNYQCADCEYETKNHLARHVRLFHYSKIDKNDRIAGENEVFLSLSGCLNHPFSTMSFPNLTTYTSTVSTALTALSRPSTNSTWNGTSSIIGILRPSTNVISVASRLTIGAV